VDAVVQLPGGEVLGLELVVDIHSGGEHDGVEHDEVLKGGLLVPGLVLSGF
jgi:hypothetical protein